MATVKASIITVGDELLIGQTIDTNSAWLAQRLGDFGIEIVRRVAVGDDAEAIRKALDEELRAVALVIMTGGLGPTADDVTKPFLCDYFGGSLRVDEAVLKHVTEIFTRRNLPVLDRNLRQAEVPDNCTVLFNKQGTAPGMLFQHNIGNHQKFLIALPGVPHEMIGIVEDEVVPFIQRQFLSDAMIHKSILTVSQGESFIAERIKDLEEALPPHIRLAYLPGPMMVKLRLTGRGADKLRLDQELTLRQEEIANRLEDIVVALEDLPLEQIIGKKLTVLEKTLGLAESCTGGYIAHRITQVMGSAKYFNGSIVCYQNEIKENLLGVDSEVLKEQGAVCEEVAVQMARGAMKVLNTDYGFGVTGLLSPGGEDNVPVGTVWMSVCDKHTTKTRKFLFPYDRLRNKEVAVNMALLLIWKFMCNKL